MLLNKYVLYEVILNKNTAKAKNGKVTVKRKLSNHLASKATCRRIYFYGCINYFQLGFILTTTLLVLTCVKTVNKQMYDFQSMWEF